MPRTRLDATDLVIAEAHLQIVRIHLRKWRALQRRLERRARILCWAVGKRPDQSRGGPRPNAEEVRLAERDLVDPAEAARRNAGGGARLRAPRPAETHSSFASPTSGSRMSRSAARGACRARGPAGVAGPPTMNPVSVSRGGAD